METDITANLVMFWCLSLVTTGEEIPTLLSL